MFMNFGGVPHFIQVSQLVFHIINGWMLFLTTLVMWLAGPHLHSSAKSRLDYLPRLSWVGKSELVKTELSPPVESATTGKSMRNDWQKAMGEDNP